MALFSVVPLKERASLPSLVLVVLLQLVPIHGFLLLKLKLNSESNKLQKLFIQ